MKHYIILIFTLFFNIYCYSQAEYVDEVSFVVTENQIIVDGENKLLDRTNNSEFVTISFYTSANALNDYNLDFTGINNSDTKIKLGRSDWVILNSTLISVNKQLTNNGKDLYYAYINKTIFSSLLSNNENDENTITIKLVLSFSKTNCLNGRLNLSSNTFFVKSEDGVPSIIINGPRPIDIDGNDPDLEYRTMSLICNDKKWYEFPRTDGYTYTNVVFSNFNIIINNIEPEKYYMKQSTSYSGTTNHNGEDYDYLVLSPTSSETQPSLTIDSRSPRIQETNTSIVQNEDGVNEQDIDNDFVSFQIQLSDKHYTPLTDDYSETLIFYKDEQRTNLFKSLHNISFFEGSSNGIDNNKGRTLNFRAPSINGSFFRDEDGLNTSLYARFTSTDLAGNSRNYDFKVNLTNAPITINPSEFNTIPSIINGTGVLNIDYSYLLDQNNNTQINRVRSQAILQKNDGTFITNASIIFTDNQEFTVSINKENIGIIEGERFELLIRLEDNLGNSSIHTSSSIYDGSAPQVNSQNLDEVVINSNWIDLSGPMKFKFDVSDYALNLNQGACNLSLKGIMNNGNEKSITLPLHNTPVKNAAGVYNLEFVIPIDAFENLRNKGALSTITLNLNDQAGNTYSSSEIINALSYEKEENISINTIAYIQYDADNNEIVNPSTLTNGKLKVAVGFSGSMNSTNDININILNTKKEVTISQLETENTNPFESFYFVIDNINSEDFFNNTNFSFETILKNKSNIERTFTPDAPLIILPIDFTIEKLTDSLYVRNGSIIQYQHSLLNSAISDNSIATLIYTKNGEEINQPLTLVKEDITSNFNVVIPNLLNIDEGTVMQVRVNLYETDGGRREASITNSFIYDFTPPRIIENGITFTGINENEPIDITLPTVQVDDIEPIGWVNLAEPTIFTIEVEDLILNPNSCKLELVHKGETNTSLGFIDIYRSSTEGHKTNLEFLIQNDILPSSGTVILNELILEDQLGNTTKCNGSDKITCDNTREIILNKSFKVEKTPPFNVKTTESDILYSKDGEVLKAGLQTIKIPYESEGLSSVEIRFLGLIEGEEAESEITFTQENNIKYITISVNISHLIFHAKRKLEFDISVVNNANEIITINRIVGPEIVFPVPSNVTVNYDNVQINKWSVSNDGTNDDLEVTIESIKEISDEQRPNLNGDTLFVYLRDNENDILLEQFDIREVDQTSHSFTLSKHLFLVNDQIEYGPKILGFQMGNRDGRNTTTYQTLAISNIPDVEITNDWRLYHDTGNEFEIVTNLDNQNLVIEELLYFPISSKNMRPEDLYLIGDEGTGEVEVNVIARAKDIHKAYIADTLRFEITTENIIADNALKPLYCSGEQGDETFAITINNRFTDYYTNLGVGELTLELYDIINNKNVENTAFEKTQDFTYQFNPLVLHSDSTIRKKEFELRLIFKNNEVEQVIGAANFETLYEPKITTELLTSFPLVGDFNVINIALSEFKERTYTLSTETKGVNIVNKRVTSRVENFSYQLTEEFDGDELTFKLNAFTSDESCGFEEEYTIAVDKVTLDNEEDLDIKNWNLSTINSNNQIIVYRNSTAGASIPWNETLGRFELQKNSQNAYLALTSDIFDISGLSKPMIKFTFESNTTERNGIFLQVRQITAQGANTAWVTVGTDAEVWNWYNTYGLYNNNLVSNENGYAWSGALGNVESRLSIDDVVDLEMDKTQFRLVFSYGTANEEFFEPKQFIIRDRERRVMVESFLQANNSTHHETLQKIYESLETVGNNDQNYIHNYYLERSLDCEDPIYERGSEWTEARRLWYGLDSFGEEDSPYSLTLDGELMEGAELQTFLDRFKYSVLKDEPLKYSYSINENELTIDYTIDTAIYNNNDNLLWVFTIGDQQVEIGECNPVTVQNTENNQVIGEIIPKQVMSQQGEVTLNLSSINSLMGSEFNIQVLLQKDYTLEVFSALQLPVSRSAVLSTDLTLENRSLLLYPNPVKNTLMIAYSETKNSEYKIFNAQGVEMCKGSLQTKTTAVDVNNFPSGIYVVTIIENGEILEVKNFIK
ncbi:T9SS type A sorting domain-containing protein [Flammeovirga kamogawensis]|uniref:T9SS type A sorting domain-containing protein n=1 Tax=Flammeovirga kamogawensis TaxID=373891 RepID=A0ABX8GYQ7_9BACT|nr:T9SS type A sorting domain-containing protein [Flammeovirga kamogawensis]MBB6462793.1 hypothetical protein [Flammeovirga kamogawensis]QWG08421.1 T9SS type A sorting domain-containing protein [Flammeovirga kamogawensis]TRX66717.1 T9SS type A sorting domain-containing protein [Flammeovirga kamogawensis]